MSNLPVGTIVFDDVSKHYRLGARGTLRSTLTELANRRRNADGQSDLWALKDVNFRVERGDSLGLIGPNGAGKTTALKLLSNVTRPTSGHITVRGRTSSLIELGAGFHPELSGRDNIFLNGAILGLKRHEIQRKLDSIVDFSELERFIDTPVKRYSSGMYVRLGFAVAAHVEPDVLLVDEVLAVGDSSFRQKCMARMDALRSSGTTLVFVSHNMHQVRRLCERALLLIGGRPAFLGSSLDAISAYEESIQLNQAQDHGMPAQDMGNDIVIREVDILDLGGSPLQKLHHNEPLQVRMHYCVRWPLVKPIVKVRLVRSDGVVSALAASHHKQDLDWTFSNDGKVSVLFDPIQLVSGSYVAQVRIADSTDTRLLASGESSQFLVLGPAMSHEPDQGTFVPNALWSHVGNQT